MNITVDIHKSTRNLNRVLSSLALCLIIYASFFSWQSWRVEKSDQIHNFQNIMELGEKAVDAFFTQLENGMLGLSRDIIETNDQIDLDHAFILVKRFKESHPELINITFIREDGQILFTAKVPPGPELPTLALEPSFLKYRNELQEGHPLSIGQPLISLMSKEWIIPLRFAVHDKEGQLAYFISANLPVEILQNYWKDAPFTKTAALGLMRDDGFMVSRYPVPNKIEMEKVYGIPRTGAMITYLRQENFPVKGNVEGRSSLDGQNYLNVFCRLEHFPITLFISLPMQEILTGWWNKVKVPYVLTVVLLIGGFLISRLTLRREHTREKERWHASEILRKSEDRFRKLFEQHAAVKLIIHPDTGNIIDANKAAADYYGWSVEELKQMQIQEINTLSPETVKSEIEKAMSSGSMRLEFRHRRADGSIRDVEVFSSKIEIAGKALLYSIVHDITERRQAEDKLIASENRFRAIINISPVPMALNDSQQQITFLNPAFVDTFGYAQEDIPTLAHWWPKAYPDLEYRKWVTDTWQSKLDMAKRTETVFSPMEVNVRCKNGTSKTVLVISTSFSNLTEDNQLVVLFDITERKQMEKELKKSEERLALALKANQDAVWDWDLLANALYYSPHWWNMVGYAENELEVDPDLWRRLMHPEDLERAWQIVNETITGGTSFEVESRLLHKDGHYVPVLTRGFVLRDGSGKPVRVSGTNTDLTRRKKIEEEKRQWELLRQQLQKIESLNRMAGAIAHHFNNLLQVVMGNLEMAMDDQPLGVNSNESLVSAMQAARKAADVSGLMLTYLGQTPGKQEPIYLSEACRQSLILLHAATPKGIVLNVDFASSGPVIRANAGQLQQVLTNLVTNAWESISDNRGTIGLTVKTVSHEDIPTSKRFPIDWQPQSIPYACLEVADNGCGISNEDIEKLFDPFFTTKFTGRGLGLPVVMGIVKAHGGGVTVESEAGHGSVFRIFLPVSTEELPLQHDLPAMPEVLPTSKAGKLSMIEGGGTVLLIEDEEQVRNMAKMMLTRLGYTVLEANDGAEALQIFQQNQDNIRCVLSDLTMPRMDGWDTLFALRKISPDIPVILSSGYDEAQVMAGEHTEQPSAFLGKPYQLKGLRDTINRVLAE